MNVQVLQHVPFEGLGSIADWLEASGAQTVHTRAWTDTVDASLDDIDLLIALGGPMSVNDESALPWLRAEKRLVREAIGRGVAVLGVCLGAQLIASALDSRVYPNPEREIGWLPVQAVAGGPGAVPLPSECTVLHWHGETFDLPQGAVRLASSRACVNQAFRYQRHVVGLQFHLETTPAGVRTLVEHCRGDLVTGPFVQSEAEVLGAPDDRFQANHVLMAGVLDWLVESARPR